MGRGLAALDVALDHGTGEVDAMTESWWLSCADPSALLRSLAVGQDYGCSNERANDARCMRLLCCGYCRLVWDLLDDHSREAVRVVEAFADGQATQDALACVEVRALAACSQ